jgi:hypothetical protein
MFQGLLSVFPHGLSYFIFMPVERGFPLRTVLSRSSELKLLAAYCTVRVQKSIRSFNQMWRLGILVIRETVVPLHLIFGRGRRPRFLQPVKKADTTLFQAWNILAFFVVFVHTSLIIPVV